MLEDWLENLRSKSTRGVYVSGLRDFVKAVGNGEDFDSFINAYATKVKSGHDPFNDLVSYAGSLVDKPPKTAGVYMHGVLSFLEHVADFELTRKQRKLLRNRMPRGTRARTIEDDLTREKLRKILTHCDTKGRALFLSLVSSGIRVGEALKLQRSDIDFESTPIKLNVRGEYTKTGDPYYSFTSKEANEALTQWLRIREEYLESSKERGRALAQTGYGRGVKTREDNRVFPFSFTTANQMWNNALKKAGLENHDKGTNRRTLHIHMLRKFFNSQLKLVVPSEIVDALMDHEEGLSEAYRRYTEAQIKDWYTKGEPHLYIFVPQELNKMRVEYKDRLDNLQDIVNGLTAKNLKLEKTVDDLSKFMEERVESITRTIVEKHLRELYEEVQETDRAEQALREQKSKEFSAKPIPKRREEQNKQASSETNFHELIFGRRSS